MIEGVLAINATSETDAEYIRGVIEYELHDYRRNKETFGNFLQTQGFVYSQEVVRFFDSEHYRYYRGQHDTGRRATLPDNWQNYGYTAGKQNGRGVSGKATSGVSEHSIISKKKTRNFYSEVDYSDALTPSERFDDSAKDIEIYQMIYIIQQHAVNRVLLTGLLQIKPHH